jgi:DNA polymerase-3 subunit chi
LTQIFFYYNAADRLGATAALLGKACRQGKSVLVYVPERALAEVLDRRLWITPPTGFIPHVRDDSPLAAETPIVLTADLATTVHNERLLNLSAEVPSAFSRFASLIEVVGREDGELREGRQRFRFYKDRGYEMQSFDLAEKSP